MEKITAFKAAVTAAIGMLTALWGWLGWMAFIWMCLMALDWITGTAAAAKNGEWSSQAARDGIWHKAGMVVVAIVAAAGDLVIDILVAQFPMVNFPFEFGGFLCPLVLVWYSLTELGSIVENASHMGAPVPSWLTKMLAAGKDAVDKAGESMGAGKED